MLRTFKIYVKKKMHRKRGVVAWHGACGSRRVRYLLLYPRPDVNKPVSAAGCRVSCSAGRPGRPCIVAGVLGPSCPFLQDSWRLTCFFFFLRCPCSLLTLVEVSWWVADFFLFFRCPRSFLPYCVSWWVTYVFFFFWVVLTFVCMFVFLVSSPGDSLTFFLGGRGEVFLMAYWFFFIFTSCRFLIYLIKSSGGLLTFLGGILVA